jgi:hypothetical protein
LDNSVASSKKSLERQPRFALCRNWKVQEFHVANDKRGTATVEKFDSKVIRVAEDNANTQTFPAP